MRIDHHNQQLFWLINELFSIIGTSLICNTHINENVVINSRHSYRPTEGSLTHRYDDVGVNIGTLSSEDITLPDL